MDQAFNALMDTLDAVLATAPGRHHDPVMVTAPPSATADGWRAAMTAYENAGWRVDDVSTYLYRRAIFAPPREARSPGPRPPDE